MRKKTKRSSFRVFMDILGYIMATILAAGLVVMTWHLFTHHLHFH